MAYEMVMPYHLHMPSYFLETFTEYPYNTDDELKANGLLPEHTTASINNMNFPTFANTLMSIYQQRFGLGSFR